MTIISLLLKTVLKTLKGNLIINSMYIYNVSHHIFLDFQALFPQTTEIHI